MDETSKEESRDKIFVNFYRTFFKKFLNPIALLDRMPCLDKAVKSRIIEAIDFPNQQVQILLEELENSDDSRLLPSFRDAVTSSPEHQWLVPIFDDDNNNNVEENINNIFEYAEKVEEVSKLWDLLRPRLHNIRVDNCIVVLSPWLAGYERENLIQKYEKYGNTYTLWWLFGVLIRKEKNWIEDFYNFVKDENYACSETYGSLAQVILEYFDFKPETQFVDKTVEQHHENYLEPPASDSLLDGHEENVEQNNIVLNIKTSTDQIQNESLHHEKSNSATNQTEVKSSAKESLTNDDGAHPETVPFNPVEDSAHNPDAASDVFPSLRNYQKELVESAANGKNVIICAPPGAGKTRVAGYVINNYLETRGNLHKPVLFFTPGAALAQQQQRRLEDILPNEFAVNLCHGNTEESSLELHYNAQVVVLTPQILLNTLMNKVEENPIQNIGQFGLYIFDECHHCLKGHAYNGVMREYFNFKRNLLPDQVLPQIIGLTATISVGKKPAEAKTEVLRLCANLDAQHGIVTVRNPANLEELDYYIPQPKQETLGIPKRENNQFYKKLVQMMDEIMKIVQEYPVFLQLDSPPKYDDFDDNLEQLIQWIQTVKREIAKSNAMEQRDIISCMEYLAFCGSAKDMFLKCRPVDALTQLERYQDFKQEEKFTEVEIKLFLMFQREIPEFERLAKDKSCANPCLERIKRVLLDKFQREPDSTGMFMVQKQIYAQAIKDWINKDEDLKFLNAEIVTGTSGGNDSMAKGMSHSQQNAVMQAFEKGKHKMLISTPEAAGEGIDVSNCNVIIEYDFLKTEVSTTQIKGRVRKDKGEVFHVSSHKVAKRDELNLQKTLLMYRTIKSVQAMMDEDPPLVYLKRLIELQEEARQAHQNALLAKLALRPKDTDKEYFIQCRKCRADVCSSLDVRVVDAGGKYTIPTSDFVNKYVLKEHPRKSQMGANWMKLNKVLCKECSNDWGIEAIWQDCLKLPLVKIQGFRVENPEGKVFLPKKWKNSPFAPAEACLDDLQLQVMQDSDSETDP